MNTPLTTSMLHLFSQLSFLHFYLPVYVITFALAGLWSFFLSGVVAKGTPLLGGLADHVVPWQRWASASTKVDIVLYATSKIVLKWIGALSTLIAVFLATKGADMLGAALHGHARMQAGPGGIALICLAMLVFDDLGNYISHLMQHKIPLLWQFHKVHHAATFLTPLTTYRFHPVGTLIDGIVIGAFIAMPVGAAAFFYRLDFLDLLAMSAGVSLLSAVFLLDLLQHSHFSLSFGPLDRIFISPRMHQVHHSMKKRHWGKNLGSKLSVWDWWFGTGYKLPAGEQIVFGMGTGQDPHDAYASVWWSFVGPFVDSARLRHAQPAQPSPDGAVTAPAGS